MSDPTPTPEQRRARGARLRAPEAGPGHEAPPTGPLEPAVDAGVIPPRAAPVTDDPASWPVRTVTGLDRDAGLVPPEAPDDPPGPANRRARTGAQVGIAGAVVVVLVWVARLVGLDMDPDGPGTNPPAEVIAAAVGIVTYLEAWRMNPGPRR